MSNTIKSLLAQRDTEPSGPVRTHADLQSRHKVARFIAEHYRDFEPLRIHLVDHRHSFHAKNDKQRQMLAFLRDRNLIKQVADQTFEAVDQDARAFFTGRWLEEYAYFAALAAGYDEVETGRMVKWRVGPDEGFNEIDVITRKEDRLLFVSCKAIRSDIRQDKKTRDRLVDFLHEADNIVDHFGGPDDRMALFCTADLYEEYNNDQSRFPPLTGKARILDVEIFSLEDLAWNDIVSRFRRLMA